ncbi:MAG: D-alanine--D-alanine ligase A, partial [Bacteroidetes bacterium]|nr:D-alanine--D-alanine ligase A [Bacteroidota bacterium]
MFPKLWEYAGISYPDLITKLITYACERFDRKSRLSTHYESNLN